MTLSDLNFAEFYGTEADLSVNRALFKYVVVSTIARPNGFYLKYTLPSAPLASVEFLKQDILCSFLLERKSYLRYMYSVWFKNLPQSTTWINLGRG